MTCATVQRQFLTEENPVKITVMTNNDFEAIGCMRPMDLERLIYLCMYQRLNYTMQPTLADCHNDLYIRKRTV